MTNPTTAPGLGGPAPSSSPASSTDTLPDGASSAPASSFDDAMREAELRVAEARNREIVEREAERRRVHLETSARLRDVEKGSEEHYALLALRQKWTLPLDDDDYVLWMQHHLLEQHGQAIADEVSQKRRARAKELARGPAIVIAIAAGLATVAGIGWVLRGNAEARRGAATPAETSGEAPAVVETTAPPAVAPAPPAATTAAPSASSSAPTVSPSGAPPAPASAIAPPAASVPKGTAPKPGGPPKKDMWEREF